MTMRHATAKPSSYMEQQKYGYFSSSTFGVQQQKHGYFLLRCINNQEDPRWRMYFDYWENTKLFFDDDIVTIILSFFTQFWYPITINCANYIEMHKTWEWLTTSLNVEYWEFSDNDIVSIIYSFSSNFWQPTTTR